jgi:hypothetical protein
MYPDKVLLETVAIHKSGKVVTDDYKNNNKYCIVDIGARRGREYRWIVGAWPRESKRWMATKHSKAMAMYMYEHKNRLQKILMDTLDIEETKRRIAQRQGN